MVEAMYSSCYNCPIYFDYYDISFTLNAISKASWSLFSEKNHPGIKHSYDIWHAAKNIGKKVNKVTIKKQIWAAAWQNQQNDVHPSKTGISLGHPPSLIRVFAVHMKKHWTLNYLLSAQWRLWSDWADAQADQSSLGPHVILLVLSWGGSYVSQAAVKTHWQSNLHY